MYSTRSYEGVLEAAHRPRDLLNSINNGALRMGGMDMLETMDKVQAHDEETQGSGSGSGISDISALENETDDFGRMLLQHQRDTRRLENAVRGGQQAFRKARPHPRIVERLEREERDQERGAEQYLQRPGSGGSNDSDPPVTVPREWGRRARKQTAWLSKITAPSENGDELVPISEDEEIYQHRTRYTGDVLQSIENTPPSMRKDGYTATPSSLKHMNTTLRPLVNVEDPDFTSNSIIASTPAPAKYHRKIDDLARREIEELETQAVTTRTLDQIDQQSPNAVLRRTSSSRLRERAIADGLRSPLMSPPTSTPSSVGKSRSPSRIPVRVQHGVSNKENIPANGDVNGRAKSPEQANVVTRSAQPVGIKKLPRPVHQRNDSMSLLKKLARVSSMSPSPSRERADAEEMNGSIAEHFDEDFGEAQAQKRDAKRYSAPEDVDHTPLPQDQPADVNTPVVAGGWVDTTLNAHVQTVPSKAESTDQAEENKAPIKSEFTKPKSALDDIVREAKGQKGAPQFGESTIQSLEDIVDPALDPTDTTMTFDFGAALDDAQEENLDDGLPLTQAEKDRRQESLAIEAMNKHLRTARTSIKDANRGLRRVGNRIDTVQDSSSRHTTKTIVRSTQHQRSREHVHCETCGGAYRSVWKALWVEFRSCFYTWDPSSKYRMRFTWLGLACLLWWMWYLSESTACSFYCKPEYATVYHGPMDGTEPVFPFVIPTLIFRPLKWLWKPVCDLLAWTFGVVFHAFFSDSSTSADPPPVAARPVQGGTFRRVLTNTVGLGGEWAATATTVAARVAHSVVDVVDEAGSMWDDEFLS